jgi:hypothetical protein
MPTTILQCRGGPAGNNPCWSPKRQSGKHECSTRTSDNGADRPACGCATGRRDLTGSTLDENSDRSFALVTPTYLPDKERCELLAESLDRVAPDVPHYLIVDRRDMAAFSHLRRGGRQLIESEALVGKWMWRMPGRKGFWLSLKAPPVRGWIIQQILKIAALEIIPERTLVFSDSDTVFFRPFSRDDLLVDGKVGLLDVDFVNDDIRRWTASARRLLGLADRDQDYHGHVGNMICWNREIVQAMQQRIEASSGMNWQVALARTASFSEYMIYGVFVREVLGYQAAGHAPSGVPLVKPSWNVALGSDAAIDAFFAEFDRRTVAVMIHSKDEADLTRVRAHLKRWWDKVD